MTLWVDAGGAWGIDILAELAVTLPWLHILVCTGVAGHPTSEVQGWPWLRGIGVVVARLALYGIPHWKDFSRVER